MGTKGFPELTWNLLHPLPLRWRKYYSQLSVVVGSPVCKPLIGQVPTDSRPRHISQKYVFDEGTPLPAQIQQLTKAGKSVSWEDNEVYLRASIILPVCVWNSSLDLIQLTPGKT